MGWHVDEEEVARDQYVRSLIQRGCLEGKEAGISLLVLDRGKKSLSSKQRFNFEQNVERDFLEKECKICDGKVELSDLIGFEDTGRCMDCTSSYVSFMREDSDN